MSARGDEGEHSREFAPLVRDLKKLRQRGGLTRRRLSTLPEVLESPAVRQRAGVVVTQHDLVNPAYDVLVEMLRSLGESREAQATRNAFAIDMRGDPLNLTFRRTAFAKRNHADPETVENWENAGITELALRLLGSTHQASSLANVDQLQRSLEVASSLSVPFITITDDLTWEIEKGRLPARLIEIRTVRALQDGIEEYPLTSYHSTDPSPDAVTYKICEGAELIDVENLSAGYDLIRIRFPRPLRQDEHHRFRWIREVNSLVQLKPFYSKVSETPIIYHIVRMRFDRDDVPHRIWQANALPVQAFPGLWSPDNRLEIDRLGYTEAEFRDLVPRLAYGIGWEW